MSKKVLSGLENHCLQCLAGAMTFNDCNIYDMVDGNVASGSNTV